MCGFSLFCMHYAVGIVTSSVAAIHMNGASLKPTLARAFANKRKKSPAPERFWIVIFGAGQLFQPNSNQKEIG